MLPKGDKGLGGDFTRRCRLVCGCDIAEGVGVTEGKPIDDERSLMSVRLGVGDCNEPNRLLVFEKRAVGDRSRILSSSVRVRGRVMASPKVRVALPLPPAL